MTSAGDYKLNVKCNQHPVTYDCVTMKNDALSHSDDQVRVSSLVYFWWANC